MMDTSTTVQEAFGTFENWKYDENTWFITGLGGSSHIHRCIQGYIQIIVYFFDGRKRFVVVIISQSHGKMHKNPYLKLYVQPKIV